MNKRIKKKKGMIENSNRIFRKVLERVIRMKYGNIPRFQYKQMYIVCMRKQKYLSNKFNSRKVEK
jgi:hypothetical protein